LSQTGCMPAPRIAPVEGATAVSAALAQLAADPAAVVERTTLATAVRYLLQVFADAHPGHSVEVRVPPFGAVQAVEGPRHTRGTPANVVELGPREWVLLATGKVGWATLTDEAKLSASGVRSDISALLPLAEW
jgi:Bacterial SCP ortholog